MHENYFNKRISNLIGMKLRFYSLKNSLLIDMHLNKIEVRGDWISSPGVPG